MGPARSWERRALAGQPARFVTAFKIFSCRMLCANYGPNPRLLKLRPPY
jgi:hypothetical protein